MRLAQNVEGWCLNVSCNVPSLRNSHIVKLHRKAGNSLNDGDNQLLGNIYSLVSWKIFLCFQVIVSVLLDHMLCRICPITEINNFKLRVFFLDFIGAPFSLLGLTLAWIIFDGNSDDNVFRFPMNRQDIVPVLNHHRNV